MQRSAAYITPALAQYFLCVYLRTLLCGIERARVRRVYTALYSLLDPLSSLSENKLLHRLERVEKRPLARFSVPPSSMQRNAYPSLSLPFLKTHTHSLSPLSLSLSISSPIVLFLRSVRMERTHEMLLFFLSSSLPRGANDFLSIFYTYEYLQLKGGRVEL